MPYGRRVDEELIKNYLKKEKMYVIDAHSHFGKDNFWPNYGDYKEYISLNDYVKELFAMSVPCPVICSENNTRTMLSYYKLCGNDLEHYRVCEKNGQRIYTLNEFGENPYKEANDYIYNLSKQTNKIKINYVPIIHPYFYSFDDFITHIKRGAKMFKIHGVACGVIPKKINKEFFQILEQLKIPIILHTDFSQDENILFYNRTQNWLEVLQNYDIKVYFAHAVRLSKLCIDIINKDDRYITGIGPDMMLNTNEYNEINVED